MRDFAGDFLVCWCCWSEEGMKESASSSGRGLRGLYELSTTHISHPPSHIVTSAACSEV